MSAFQADLAKIAGYNAQVVGINTDSVFSHMAFQKSLGGLKYPLASDRWPYAKTAEAYGVFPPAKHNIPFVNDRAVFIVNKNGKIARSNVYELREAPDDSEILNVLRKLA